MSKETPGEFGDIRRVEWLDKIKSDDLIESTKKTLEHPTTIFEIKNSAADDILKILKKFHSLNLTIVVNINEIKEAEYKFRDILYKKS